MSAQTIGAERVAAESQSAWAALRDQAPVAASPLASRVRTLLDRLLTAAAQIEPSSRSWRPEVLVLDSDALEAWCLDGARCALTRGMLARLGADDGHLAAVLAHELAHQLRGHPAERLAQWWQGGGTDTRELLLRVPLSRVHEIEADRLGVELLARAGFDPRAPLGLWRSAAANPASGWFARHPGAPSRMRDLDVYARRMAALTEQSAVGR